MGIVPTREALETARERGLDLVEVQPNASPPVCRLMDYGRFRYEESRKERESRRKSATAVVKEVRIHPKIAQHDLMTKTRQAQRFLDAGDKVKLSVLFRGREMLHQDIGHGLLSRMVQELNGVATVDQPPKMEGRTLAVMLSPRPEAKQQSSKAADEAAGEQPSSGPASADGGAEATPS